MEFKEILNQLVEDKTLSSDLGEEDAFFSISIDFLEKNGIIDDFEHSYYYAETKQKILKINGFSLGSIFEKEEDEDYDTLSLFICDYDKNSIETIKKAELVKELKKLYRVLMYCIKVNVDDEVPKANALSDLHELYGGRLKKSLIQINLYVLTNKIAGNKKELSVSDIINKNDLNDSVDYSIRIIDLNELKRLYRNNQDLDINVSSFHDGEIQVLSPELGVSSYGTAISILPANFLFNIYKEFGSKLLETNVRSSLSSRGKVNQGIKETLINNPDMFLAYHNGLCVTVSDIILNENGSVKEFKNFQIVNGGQTTSSIFFVTLDAKKKKTSLAKYVKLERVNVMTKITKIGRNIDSQIIQRKIAHNSNSQNAVKITDLSSNHSFLIKFHSLSKKVRNQTSNNYYYFERARGQYIVERDLTNNGQFELLYPRRQKFDVSEFSLIYFFGFGVIQPFISVQSATRRYEKFLYPLLDFDEKKLDDNYFKRAIGGLMLLSLFRSVYTKKEKVGEIRKNVLAYSISFIQSELANNKLEIDFTSIWTGNINTIEPKDDAWTVIRDYLVDVNNYILKICTGGRVDEACKKEETWNTFKSGFRTDLNEVLKVIPSIKISNKTPNKNLQIVDNIHSNDLNLINLEFGKAKEYQNLIKVVENELSLLKSDGDSRYGRNHFEILRSHFSPKLVSGSMKVFPKTYESYLVEIRNKPRKGVVSKKDLKLLHDSIDNLKRIIHAIKKDDNYDNYIVVDKIY